MSSSWTTPGTAPGTVVGVGDTSFCFLFVINISDSRSVLSHVWLIFSSREKCEVDLKTLQNDFRNKVM